MNNTFDTGLKLTFRDNKKCEIELIKDAIDSIRKGDKWKDEPEIFEPISTKHDLNKYVSSMLFKNNQKKGMVSVKKILKLQGTVNTIRESISQSKFKLKNMKQIQLTRLNRKIQKLKNRILPQEITVQNKIQKQLKQIIEINNKRTSGHLVHKSQNISEILNKNISKNISKYDESQIISNYWNKLQNQSKVSKSALKKIKENRINLLIVNNISSDEELKEFNQTAKAFFKKLPLQQTQRNRTKQYLSKHQSPNNKFSNIGTPSISLNCSFGQENQTNNLQMPLINRRSYLNTRSKSILDREVTRYFKSKEEKKIFLKSINKEYIQKQAAINVYSFAKGAYSLDPSDVEGQFVSLNKFNESKKDFLTLNEFYRTVKNDLQSKSYDKKSLINSINNDNSFKTLVQINEIQNKIPKSQLQKLMKKSNLVK